MKKIIVVENEASLRKLLGANLSASGYRVLTAEDGDEGLEMIRREHPDLVMLDIKMPRMSGWEVLTAMKGAPELKDIPVLVMTASARETGEKQAKSLGAAGYLLKPFNVEDLLVEVRRLVGENQRK